MDLCPCPRACGAAGHVTPRHEPPAVPHRTTQQHSASSNTASSSPSGDQAQKKHAEFNDSTATNSLACHSLFLPSVFSHHDDLQSSLPSCRSIIIEVKTQYASAHAPDPATSPPMPYPPFPTHTTSYHVTRLPAIRRLASETWLVLEAEVSSTKPRALIIRTLPTPETHTAPSTT